MTRQKEDGCNRLSQVASCQAASSARITTLVCSGCSEPADCSKRAVKIAQFFFAQLNLVLLQPCQPRHLLFSLSDVFLFLPFLTSMDSLSSAKVSARPMAALPRRPVCGFLSPRIGPSLTRRSRLPFATNDSHAYGCVHA